VTQKMSSRFGFSLGNGRNPSSYFNGNISGRKSPIRLHPDRRRRQRDQTSGESSSSGEG